MRRVEAIIFEHEEKLEKERELARAQIGDSFIERYFKLYGVLNNTGKHDRAFHSEIMYDGRPTLDNWIGWNSEIDTMHVSVAESNGNYHYKKPGFVKLHDISILKCTETSIEAGMSEGKPTMRHCHGWYNDLHEEWRTKYTTEEWRRDLSDALDLYIRNVSELFDRDKPIMTDKHGYMFQEGKDYLTRIHYDNIGTLRLQQMEVFQPGKYREAFGLGVGKLPKFTKEVTFDHVKNELVGHYVDLMRRTAADREFRF